MKRALCLLLSAIMVMSILISIPITTIAAETSDLTFELNKDGKSYSVKSCKEEIRGKLTIPAKYNGKSVTSIGQSAFSRCTGFTGVLVIPEGITRIERDVFFNRFFACISLSRVTRVVNPFPVCFFIMRSI